MKIRNLFLALLLVLIPSLSLAQVESEGVQSFAQPEGAWKRSEQEDAKKVNPLEIFTSQNGKIAIDNIVNAEQVFCYEIFPRNDEYEGYALNGFPIRGFCGVLGEQVRDMVGEYFLSTPTNVDFENAEQCVVQPKVVIRFIRGVDFTDMLISSPCHSFAIFYGGGLNVYNFKPGAEILDALVKALSGKHADFVSPALLNQLLPVGVVQNDQQRKIVNKRSEPIRKWEEKTQKEEEAAAVEKKKNESGWNKLKMRQL